MRDQNVIFDTEWRLDDEGLADYVNESDWLRDADDMTQRMEYADYIFSLKDDERANLNISLGNMTVLAYGTQQRWCGPNSGADPLGNNVNSIFDWNPGDEIRYYVENGDVWARSYDHDGATVVCFRAADPSYIDMLESGEPIGGEDAFMAATQSLAPYVCGVYGW